MASKKNRKREVNEQTLLRDTFAEYELLTAEEEKALLMRRDDMDAREKLVCHNARLVMSIVRKYEYVSELSFGDLFQIGVEGLLAAIRGFDLEMGVRLSTYATDAIRGNVKKNIRKNSSVYVPDSVKTDINNLTICEKKLAQILNRKPEPEEIAAALNISVEELEQRQAIRENIQAVSLSQSLYGDEDTTLEDTIEDPADLEEKLDLYIALDRLNHREREIIRLHHDLGLSQAEIAIRLGVSKQRIQQLEKAAMEKLKEYLSV